MNIAAVDRTTKDGHKLSLIARVWDARMRQHDIVRQWTVYITPPDTERYASELALRQHAVLQNLCVFYHLLKLWHYIIILICEIVQVTAGVRSYL